MDPLTTAALISAGGSILGGVLGRQKAPKQAEYKPVDPNAVAKQTISGNLQNFDAASKLAGQTNQFNQNQATALLEQAMPGFSAMQKKMLATVDEDLASQNSLPQDVKDQISRFAAEKGVTRGTSGNFNSFNLVKDFGFNLLDWRNASRARAMNTLSTVYGMTPRVNPMSPMAMMVDPNTAINVQGQNNQMAYNVQQAGYNAQAAASNYNRMLMAGTVSNLANVAAMPFQMKGYQQMGLFGKPTTGAGGGTTPTYGPDQ